MLESTITVFLAQILTHTHTHTHKSSDLKSTQSIYNNREHQRLITQRRVGSTPQLTMLTELLCHHFRISTQPADMKMI